MPSISPRASNAVADREPFLLTNVTEVIMFNFRTFVVLLISVALFPATAFASSGPINLTLSPIGLIALGLFALAYMLVMAEEKIHLRKFRSQNRSW